MNTIVFLSTYSLDEPVLKNRITPFIDQALDRGLSVTLVNPAGGEYHRSEHPNFHHKHLSVPQANRGNFFVRTIREITLARKVIANAPDHSDIVFVTIPSMFLLFVFKRRPSKISVLDIRDLTWEYLSDASWFMRIVKKCFRFIARIKIRAFDLFSVTNTTEHGYLTERLGLDPGRVILCPNGISREQYQQVSSVGERSLRSAAAPFRVAYVGNIGVAQNLLTLIETAKLLPHVEFIVVGGGSDFERIEEAAKGIPNFHLRGRVSWDQVPQIYRDADVLWAQLAPAFSGAMPSKLYEYLATGKPIIYGGMGEATSVLSGFENVSVVMPEEPDELASSIQELVDRGDCSALSLSNRKKIEDNYIRESAVERFYDRVLK